MRGTKHHIHRANKNRGRNSDAEKIDELQSHLTLQRIFTVRETAIHDELFSTRNHLRVPDLTLTGTSKTVIIELDGGVHGDLELPNEKTLRRNADYNRAGIIYIILNEQQCEAENIDFCDLASYRVREVLSKLKAGEME